MQLRIKALVSSLSVLLLLAPIAPSWACFPDISNRIEVSPSGPCTDIQAAIDVADGFNLLSIDVLPGDYVLSAPLQLKSYVNLIGAGAETTTVTLQQADTHSIRISNVDNVTVSGFTLSAGGFDIKNSNNLTVSNNIVNNSKYGIYGLYISGLNLTQNTFNQNDFSIVLEETDTAVIDNNVIDAGIFRQGDGINLYQTFVTVTNNTIQGNIEAGIEISYGGYTITGNTITLQSCSASIIETHETNANLIPSAKNISGNTVSCG